MKKYILIVLISGFCMTASATGIKKTDSKGSGWNIITANAVYQIRIDDKGTVYPVFYGAKAHETILAEQERIRQNGPFLLEELPVRGQYADKMPILEVIYADKTRDCELLLVSINKTEINGRETLKIVQKDRFYPLEVISYMRVLPEYDIIEKWMEVTNTGKKAKEGILIENLLSGSFNLPSDQYYLNHHSGQWLKEFQLRKVELTTGIKTLQARDFYSFQNTPWFAVTNEKNDDKEGAEVWFGQVHYSGNWRIDFETTHSNHLQIVGGINFWDTSLMLEAGETFVTPKFSIGYTNKGTEVAAQQVRQYVQKEILPKQKRERIRPVIYNSWYATGFNLSEGQQLTLAKKAKEIGVELFVVDDGWFKGRKLDTAGLGDWEVDLEKFPNGLQSLISKINELGLDFGIWVEPEMINPNSDLYRKHPDWTLHFPNREKTEWRNQLTLNLAREDVYNYLLESMTSLLRDHNIRFIKWDRNRGLTQPGWPAAGNDVQREVRIKYMENLYKLIDTLEERFPNVTFETCSSGGGRPDLGMLERMDQTWASDNTDPVDRLFIQYGFLSAYPANTMVCWTNSSDSHRTGLSLNYTFDVAMQGVLGIGQDITRWNEEQTAIAIRKIAEYKEIRTLVQQGLVYRLKSPFDSNKIAIQYTDNAQSDAVILCYNLGEVIEGTTTESMQRSTIKLKNLKADKFYTIEGHVTPYSGAYLMDVGIKWPIRGVYKSTLLKVTSVK